METRGLPGSRGRTAGKRKGCRRQEQSCWSRASRGDTGTQAGPGCAEAASPDPPGCTPATWPHSRVPEAGGWSEGAWSPAKSELGTSPGPQVSHRKGQGMPSPTSHTRLPPEARTSPRESRCVSSCLRFPNLFPPLKPETVARRTVEAVQLNQALLLLPWTMNILIILKRYGIGGSCQTFPFPSGPWWGSSRQEDNVID